MKYRDLGLIQYADAWDYQTELFNSNLSAKATGAKTENTLILCEHQHVITIGKSGNNENLLCSERFLNEKGIALFKIDRGGDVTYHGPGQVVAYPILDLETFDLGLRQYIYNLEELVIQLLAQYAIKADRLEGATGVWLDVNNEKVRKICAIGVRSSRFVTMHGFALNVNTDLSYFSLINPCGFRDKGVTSMQQELGHLVDMTKLKEEINHLFNIIFIQKSII